MADWVALLLTAVLVGATTYYARQARATVNAMEAARRQGQEPRLRLDLRVISRDHVVVDLRNVGNGPAFDLRVTLTFQPPEKVARSAEMRDWRTPVLAPDDRVTFHFPKVAGEDRMDLPAVVRCFRAVEMGGTAVDSDGETHSISDSIGDFGDFAALYERGDFHPEEEVADHLGRLTGRVERLGDISADAVLLAFRCPECDEPLAPMLDEGRALKHPHSGDEHEHAGTNAEDADGEAPFGPE